MFRWNRLAKLLALVLTLTLTGPVFAGSAVADPTGNAPAIDTLQISGRGAGHGRGMSQYGAFGYAAVDHWSRFEILDHYYGNTQPAQTPASSPVNPQAVRVDLRSLRNQPTIVSVGSGGLTLSEADGSNLLVSTESAVRLVSQGAGFSVQTGSSCDGPWSGAQNMDATFVKIESQVSAGPAHEPSSKDDLLQVCGEVDSTWYAGTVEAHNVDGQMRTTNTVTVEQYLRGVVPNEMVASWPEAALQAQAVTARSYLMAGDHRQLPYADTCDTTRCQVYDGVFSTRKGENHAATHPRTDAAIAATAGEVRVFADGSIARTEYSASSGGHTIEGDFPAVVDNGDSMVANPFHLWEETIDTAGLVEYHQLGDLIGVAVTERDGQGAFGGRVSEIEFQFRQGAVEVDGRRARGQLGLRSDWFTIG